MGMKLTKVVLKLISNGKVMTKAMKIAAAQGVILVEIQGADQDLLVVIGEGLDPSKLTHLLRKKVGPATIVSVQQLQERRSHQQQELSGIQYYHNPCNTRSNYPTTQWQYPHNCPVNPMYQVVCYDRDDPSSCSTM